TLAAEAEARGTEDPGPTSVALLRGSFLGAGGSGDGGDERKGRYTRETHGSLVSRDRALYQPGKERTPVRSVSRRNRGRASSDASLQSTKRASAIEPPRSVQLAGSSESASHQKKISTL